MIKGRLFEKNVKKVKKRSKKFCNSKKRRTFVIPTDEDGNKKRSLTRLEDKFVQAKVPKYNKIIE